MARYSISGFPAALFSVTLLWFLGTAIAHSFDLQGHRGARGLAPENTLEAFAQALRTGVSTLELDTAVTKDGVVVVAHDRRLNPSITRGPDGRWLRRPTPAVHELTYEQLQRYDVGRIDPASEYARRFPGQRGRDGLRMPRLADVFELVRRSGNRQVRFNIETKISPLAPKDSPPPGRFVELLVKTVREADMVDRVTIQSFYWRTLRMVHGVEPRIATSFLTSQQPGSENIRVHGSSSWTAGFQLRYFGTVPEMVRAAALDEHGDLPAGSTWSPNFADLTQAAVREAQLLGLKVVPWTVNAREDMVRMIDWKVDGLITDYPDRARDILLEKGLPLPPATPMP
jgi:glycerophosphoryl diester phosphodiesterase